MGSRMKNVNIFGVYWNIQFSSGGGVTENQYIGGLGQLADLGGAWQEREGVFLRKGVDTPIHTMSSQNNLKVTTNYYEKKCLLVITKNKKHLSKQDLPITYILNKRVFVAVTFQCLWVASL